MDRFNFERGNQTSNQTVTNRNCFNAIVLGPEETPIDFPFDVDLWGIGTQFTIQLPSQESLVIKAVERKYLF
jgi:hypothetical protein